MIIAYASILVALVGGLVYGFAANAKLSTLGLVTYGCGLLAFCFSLASHVVRIG